MIWCDKKTFNIPLPQKSNSRLQTFSEAGPGALSADVSVSTGSGLRDVEKNIETLICHGSNPIIPYFGMNIHLPPILFTRYQGFQP